MYPVIFIDALMVKIRDGVVTNRAVYLAIGIDCEGNKQVLGLWIGPTTGESAKFWLSVLSDLKSRGVAEACIVCCDALTGLPDAIGVVWPQAIVQLCVVHLIRASLRYASRKYWVPLAKDLKLIYTACDEAAAAAALDAFANRPTRGAVRSPSSALTSLYASLGCSSDRAASPTRWRCWNESLR